MKRLLPLLICLFTHAAWAEAPGVETITPQEREQLLDRAKSLKDEAGRIKTAAQEKRKQADVACWKKTLVSACLNEARRENIDRNAEARKLEIEANKIEREVRERDRAPSGRGRPRSAENRQPPKKIAKAKEQDAAQRSSAKRRRPPGKKRREGAAPGCRRGSARKNSRLA
jgi:hypothetical protein